MKIGIMGGTFDPVHLGHTEMAAFCKNEFGLDKIMFLPLGDAPHKKDVTDKNIRLKMLYAATKNNPDFFVSTVETDRKGKTYSFDTLTYLKENTDGEYFFIIGEDTAEVLMSWHRAEEVFQMVEFIVVGRTGFNNARGVKDAQNHGAKLHFANHTGLDISSSEIREKVKSGQSAEKFVDKGVWEIIKTYGLYKN